MARWPSLRSRTLSVVSKNSCPRRVSLQRSASGIVTLIARALTSTATSLLMDAWWHANGHPLTPRRTPDAGSFLERGLERGELGLGLRQLGGGVGARDDAAPGEQPRGVLPDEFRTPQRQPELAVPAGVQPADGAGVAPAIHALELGDHRRCFRGRRAAHRGGGVDRADEVQQPRPT